MPRKNSNARSPHEHARAIRIWKHNSFRGHTTMFMKNLNSMRSSDSVTDEARVTIFELDTLVNKLHRQLKERKDP